MASECQKVGRDVSIGISIERYEVVGDARYDTAVNKALSTLKARISLVTSTSGQHVEWTLRVIHEGKAWALTKRFSEVAALHDVLRRRLPSIPPLPPKSTVRQFSLEYLEARKAGLQSYLTTICRRRDVMNTVEAQTFVGLPEHVPSFRQPCSAEPIQVAEVQEVKFGVAAFAYEPAHGLLVLGASEMSLMSRFDTKLVNIKLPWEQAPPNVPSSQLSLWKQSPADLSFEMQAICRYTASLSSCALLMGTDGQGMCLCGLSDGRVGFHPTAGQRGVTQSGKTLPLLRHTAAVISLAVDSVEHWLFSGSKDRSIKVYDARRERPLCEVQSSAPATSMHFCAEQKKLFCGLVSGFVAVWDTSTVPIALATTIPHYAAAADGFVPAMSSTTPFSAITALDFDAAKGMLFSASCAALTISTIRTSGVSCWARKAGQILDLSGKPTAILWANSSHELLVGFASGAVVIFDIDLGEAAFAIQAHEDAVTSMMWMDAPRRLLTSSADKTLKFWDFPSMRRTPLEDQIGFAPSVSVSTFRGSIATGRGVGGGGAGGADAFGGDMNSPLGRGGSPLSGAAAAAPRSPSTPSAPAVGDGGGSAARFGSDPLRSGGSPSRLVPSPGGGGSGGGVGGGLLSAVATLGSAGAGAGAGGYPDRQPAPGAGVGRPPDGAGSAPPPPPPPMLSAASATSPSAQAKAARASDSDDDLLGWDK